MRTMIELLEERDRLRMELSPERAVDDRWARSFLAGALAAMEWMRGKNAEGNPPRPSALTRPEKLGG